MFDDPFCVALLSRLLKPPLAMDKRLLNNLARLSHLIDAHEDVHLRQQFRQFIAKSLRQTAGHNQALVRVRGFAELRRLQNRVHAFLLGRIDERASIDDHYIRLFGVVDHLHAGTKQRAEHDLGIDQILGATKRNQANSNRAFCVLKLHEKRAKLRHRPRQAQTESGLGVGRIHAATMFTRAE